MKKNVPLLLIAVLAIYLGGCKKSTVTGPPDFSKITVTDSVGLYTGTVDSTDWTYDETWTPEELAFMNFTDTFALADTVAGFVQVSALYPNPNHGIFSLLTTVEKECKMKVAIVSTSMHLISYNTFKFLGGPVATGFNCTVSTAFHPNENYRIYYGFYNAKGTLFYKGHGDFRIE